MPFPASTAGSAKEPDKAREALASQSTGLAERSPCPVCLAHEEQGLGKPRLLLSWKIGVSVGDRNLRRSQHHQTSMESGEGKGRVGKEETCIALFFLTGLSHPLPAYPAHLSTGLDDTTTTATLGDRGPRHPPPATGLIMIMYFFPSLSP